MKKVKGKYLIVFYFILFWYFDVKSQEIDTTLFLNTFTVIDNKVVLPDSYSQTKFDSLDKAQYRHSNISGLLSESSPVFIKKYSLAGLSTPGLRGTGSSHTKVFWNGMELNSPMNGTIDLSLLPVSFFDDIRLHQGSSSIINGSGGLGGSLQLTSSTKWNKGWGIDFSQSAGSFENYDSRIKLNFATKRFSIKTKAFYARGKNNFPFINIAKEGSPVEKRKNAAFEQKGMINELDYLIDEKQTLSAFFWINESNRELPGGINSGEKKQDQFDASKRGLVEWRYKGNKTDFIGRAGMENEEIFYTDSLSGIYSENSVNSYFTQGVSRFSLPFSIQMTAKYRLTGDIAISNGYEENKERLTNSFFIGASKEFNRLQLDFMSRMELINEHLTPLLPSFGWSYDITGKDNWFWKGNASINFQYPTFNDLYWNPGGNAELQPEKSRNIETGTLINTEINKKYTLSAQATAYYMYIRNWIAWIPGDNGYWKATNYKEVENKGVEFQVSANTELLGVFIKAEGNYNFISSKNKSTLLSGDNSLGKQLIYVPGNTAGLSVFLEKENFYLNYVYTFNDKRFITTDNSMYMPSYQLNNLSLGKLFNWNNSKVELKFTVNNILNEQYQSIAWQPMPGRYYSGMLRFKFHGK